jgi:predicted DNA binding CopG/RHH family protein
MKKKIKLDAYERDILKNFGKGKKLKNEKAAIAMLVQAAKNYVAEKKSVTIRIANGDLEAMRLKAQKMGVPYQTYINIVIHQDAVRLH